ncbi:MAG: hypothetical protein IH944_06965 [Armatimonadetes bacterium]|nr:hypothetical protein [Armatimonadota bacterium]
MKQKTTLLAVLLGLAVAMTGCGAAVEAADEGANAFQSGMRSKDQAIDIAEKKEAFEAENDF